MNAITRAYRGVRKSLGLGGPTSPLSGVPRTWSIDWFQQGKTPNYWGGSSVVEACVSAYAQTIAQLPPCHYRKLSDGSREKVMDSTPIQALSRPNYVMTTSDFLLNLVHGILYEGNGYFLSLSDPETTTEIWLMDPRVSRARHIQGGGESEVFYSVGGEYATISGMLSNAHMVPSDYVGHVKLFTPFDPLVGVTPIQNAAASVSANQAIVGHQASFFNNMTRPSGVLSTDLTLTREQMTALREAWEDQSKGMNSGGIPILAGGLKWEAMSLSAQDAQMVEAWRMTVEDISRVFRVPPMLINNMQQATFNNAEALMSFWLASGLGFLVNHIEQVLTRFFRLPPDECIELDTDVLMRTNLETRIKTLGEGVTKGIYGPNEARSVLHLPPVEGGELPRVQQQMVPLDYDPSTAAQPEPAPASPEGAGDEEPPEPPSGGEGEGEVTEESVTAHILKYRRAA